MTLAVRYETREVLDDTGLAHLEDDLSAANYRPPRGPVERRAPCSYCREAAGREAKRRERTEIR